MCTAKVLIGKCPICNVVSVCLIEIHVFLVPFDFKDMHIIVMFYHLNLVNLIGDGTKPMYLHKFMK
jgi:hypothetical protein